MISPDDQSVMPDETDWEILRRLNADARMPNTELARAVGLSPSACHARLRSLRKRGVISRFTVELNTEVLGYSLQALVSVRVRTGARHLMGQLSEELKKLPEVAQLFILGGTEDFLVHIQVKDADHVRQFVLENLSSNPAVSLTQTSIVFEHHSA